MGRPRRTYRCIGDYISAHLTHATAPEVRELAASGGTVTALLLAALRTKEVEVPQWKTTLTVQELDLQDSMLAFGSIKPDSGGNVTLSPDEIASVVALGVVDENGDRVFTDEQVPQLVKKNHKALMLLYTEITKLSGSIEDEVKN